MNLKIRCGKETKEVNATRIIKISGFKLFAHRTEKYFDYVLSEYQTGMRVGGGKTIKSAVAKVGETVRERGGIEYFQKAVNSGIERYGIINY
jgi:hypothetical protein